jgi:hypothetical protein
MMNHMNETIIRQLLPERRRNSHKGDYGKILLLCGSRGFTGAAALAARGALRTGAGLVYLAVPERIYAIEAVKLTEPVVLPMPDREGMLCEDSIPKIAELLPGMDAVLFGWSFLSNLLVGRYFLAFLPVVAILNYFIFFWQDFRWLFARVKRRTDPTVINFKKAQKQAQKKAEETHGYIHKCAVCGVTDAENPDMEFRYCSKCDGYYCYCMDHINNHVHVKQ